MAREAFVRRKVVISLFILATLTSIIVGLMWPSRYTSSTTILVEDKNIIQPLMQGTAVDTVANDRASIAREVIYGHRIMNQIAHDAGWINANSTPKEEADVIQNILIPATQVTHVGDNRNLIKIQYSDSNAKRAFLTAKELADLFISATLQAKAKESEDAFNFIDQQVQQYRAKLTTAEDALKKFQSANLTARPGSEGEIGRNLNTIQDKIDATSESLKEAEIQENSLKKQLYGEATATAEFYREGQYRASIAKLQSRLATLRLNYQDTYPDIVHIKHQIADLDAEIQKGREQAQTAKASGRRPELSTSLVDNPLYQKLRQELSQTQTLIATLRTRLADYQQLLAKELKLGREVHGGEATLAELTRDYTVNRDIYQDLLRRRENARVTMNLDKQKEGLTFQIQDHAMLPLEPEGLRFADFIIVGLFVGLVLPVGLLFAKIKLDPRICDDAVIYEKLRIPMLTVVPHLFSPSEAKGIVRSVRLLTVATLADLIIIIGVSALKLSGVI